MLYPRQVLGVAKKGSAVTATSLYSMHHAWYSK